MGQMGTKAFSTMRLGTKAFSTMRQNVPAVGAWGDLAKCSRAVRIGDVVRVAGTCAPGDCFRHISKMYYIYNNVWYHSNRSHPCFVCVV